MFVIVSVSIIALFLAFLESNRNLKHGLLLGFLLITIVGAIRYNYGTDYIGYSEDFKNAGSYQISDFFYFKDAIKDFGWSILMKIFQPLGFFSFVAFITFLSNYIFYRFIKENVEREDYWLAMFLYLFTFDMYVLQFSMLRQGLVIALFVWSYHFIKKKKYILPIILTLLSISFHKSSIIIVPFLFLGMVPLKNGRLISITLLALFLVFFISRNFINDLLNSVIQLDLLSTYQSDYMQEGGTGIGVRAILSYIPFLVSIYYFWDKKTVNGPRYLVLLSMIGTLIAPFTTIVHMISRVGYYFDIFTIASVPIAYKHINNKIIRLFLLLILIIITIYVYFDRFTNSIYTNSISQFHTIYNAL